MDARFAAHRPRGSPYMPDFGAAVTVHDRPVTEDSIQDACQLSVWGFNHWTTRRESKDPRHTHH